MTEPNEATGGPTAMAADREERLARVRRFIQASRVEPGRPVTLPNDFDPRYTADFVRREDAEDAFQDSVAVLAEYQARLAAQDTWALLVIFQAMDAAGKDGTIRHVMSGVNPQGVEVTS
ncbi:MAG TPA: polyphosphate kinase 2 family protein, partial [Patescibacteria group bacterium]|nr:polyphosphate kinase 2 family protein [Patescibacteria group bacterium]